MFMKYIETCLKVNWVFLVFTDNFFLIYRKLATLRQKEEITKLKSQSNRTKVRVGEEINKSTLGDAADTKQFAHCRINLVPPSLTIKKTDKTYLLITCKDTLVVECSKSDLM